jgi:predicted acyltransferase
MQRLESVDAMRGATIAGMIVVNNPGTWSAVYAPLRHAEWHGWTYTDTIFPFFLFLVGVSMALSFGTRRHGESGGDRSALVRKTVIRAAILVALGLLLNLVGFLAFDRENYRIPGVLQRIGLCVLAGGLVYLAAGARGAAWTAAGLLLVYGALLASSPLDPEGSLPSRLDRAVFGAHTWSPAFDPEGLLSTLGAIATTLLGTLAGERLRAPLPMPRRLGELLAAGGAATLLGLAVGRLVPINKNLWTPSYVVLMAGLAAIVLAICVWLVDAAGARRIAAPFVWLGRNAIAAFTLSSLASTALIAIRVPGPAGKTRSLWTAIYRGAFDRFADPRLGSLLFALAYLAVWIAIFGLLYRKRIFVKI